MSDRGFRRFILVVVLLLTGGSPAFAEVAARPRATVEVCPTPAAILLADSWSIGKFVAGGGRARILQICVVVMCIALFIMTRKLH